MREENRRNTARHILILGLEVEPWAVEPVSDVAVLGSLDNQECYKEAEAFEDFCDSTTPIALAPDQKYELFAEFPIRVFTHDKGWIGGVGKLCQEDASRFGIQTQEQIEGGTSGGPIVDENGHLLGVVSNASVGDSQGLCPRLRRALPVWVLRDIDNAEVH